MNLNLKNLWIGALMAPIFAFPSEPFESAALLENATVNSSRELDERLSQSLFDNPSVSIDDLMLKMPGASLVRRGPFGQDLVIRGDSGPRVALEIDGMTLHGACTDRMDPVSIYAEPQNMQSFENSLGAESFESGASGGSLNLALAKARVSPIPSQKWSLRSGAALAERSLYGAVLFDQTAEKWGFHSALVARGAHNYHSANNQEVAYSGYQKVNFSASVLRALNPLWDIEFKALVDRGDNLGYPALSMDAGYALAQLYALSLQYHSESSHGEFKVFWNGIDHEMDDTHRDSVAMHMDMPGEAQTQGLIGIWGTDVGEHHYMFKLEADHQERFANMTMYMPHESDMYLETWPQLNRSRAALTFSPVFTWGSFSQKVILRSEVATSEMEHLIGEQEFSIFSKNPTTARADIVWGATLIHSLNTSIGELSLREGYGERMPDLPELWGYYLYDARSMFDQVGNPDLVKERFFQGEVAYQSDWTAVDLGVNAWFKQYEDFIAPRLESNVDGMTPGSKGLRVYQNTARVWMMGQEAHFNWVIHPSLEMQNRADYVWGEHENGEPLGQMDPLHGMSAIRYSWNGLSNPERWLWVIEYEWALQQERVSSSDLEVQSKSWFIFNLKTSRTLRMNSMRNHLSLEFTNILDESYKAHLDWGKSDRPGRSVKLGWALDF
jgi:iron complex outermembrane recepter protein